MNIQDDHFALFGLEPAFDINAAALDRAYRDVQTQVHPDRFAGAGAAEQRVALQWATRVNEAYRVLRDPLRRAVYLCGLQGRDANDERNTRMPQAFLIQQLEWREALDAARDAGDATEIDALRRQLGAVRVALQGEVGRAFAAGDLDGAVERVRRWMFVARFEDDVVAAEGAASAALR